MMALLLTAVGAAATTYACPATIVDRQTAQAPSGGWAVEADNHPRRLESGAVFDGPPSKRVDVMGKPIDSGMRWEIVRGKHYIVCSYQNTSVRLVQTIEGPITCTWKEGNTFKGLDPSFLCK